ncbi:MAG: tRNA pseudouridine(38-40) synthase TruA [Acidimicrobiales bacterium]
MSSSEPATRAATRWRLDLAYDGTGLHGFAPQPGRETVAGLVGAALTRLTGVGSPIIVAAGRTDAGVHALAQVLHVDLPSAWAALTRIPAPERLARSLNSQLAGRVRVDAARVAPDDFHARFSARWRAYRYLVLEEDGPALAFTSHWSWSVPGPLDLAAMNRIAAAAEGVHDFRAFCRRPSGAPDEPLIREVLAARWARHDDDLKLGAPGASVLRFEVVARSFCHTMVRSLVGAMVAVGRGTQDEGFVTGRLHEASRVGLARPAPPGGLALVGVGYDSRDGGPAGVGGPAAR